MRALDNIINQLKKHQDGTNTPDNFKCNICRDTTWVQSKNGFARCECYKKNIIETRWKKFGVNPSDIKLLREYKVNTAKQKEAIEKAVEYIKKFDNIKKRRNTSIAFLGQHGSGKTHIALAIGKALLERTKHVEVVYMPYLEALRELKANVNEDLFYRKIQSQYINCELLIIDDLFKDKVKKGKLCYELNEADMKHIYPIINQRYINHLPTIYNSECDPGMLEDLDGALAGRILESCKENIIVFAKCEENNYRIKDL